MGSDSIGSSNDQCLSVSPFLMRQEARGRNESPWLTQGTKGTENMNLLGITGNQ